MYKTMHEKANSKTPRSRTPAAPQPPTTRSSTPTNANTKPKQKQKLDKTVFDLLTDVTAELIVESAKLDRLGRYLTKK